MSKKVYFTREQRQFLEDNLVVASTIATNIVANVDDDTPIRDLPDSVIPTHTLYSLVLAYMGVLETLSDASIQVTNIANKTIH